MRVLIIHNRYQTKNVGGEDVVFESELAYLRKVLGSDKVWSYEVCNDDASMVELLRGLFWSIRHQRAVAKLVRDYKIDIVHIHNYFPLLSPSIFKGAQRAGAKVVQTLHSFREWCISGVLYRNGSGPCEKCVGKLVPVSGIVHKCFRGSRMQSLAAQVAFSFYRATNVWKYVDAAFVLTPSQQARVYRYGGAGREIMLKPNSVAVPIVESVEKQGFLFVGRLEEEKGIVVLLEAWNRSNLEGVLRVVGVGPLEAILKEKFASQRTIFLGRMERKDTLAEISRSRYLVQPSLMYETFGLTVLEAYSFGTPVIGFSIGTRVDLIQHQVTGFLCQPKDLGRALSLAAHWPNYQDLSRNARKLANQYSEEALGAIQVGYYQRILNQ